MLYEHKELGVLPGSELFLSTPSRLAESVLFYLHRCGLFKCTAEYRIQRNNFNNYLIILVENGKMKITFGGKTALVKKGDVVFINCHMPHSYEALEDGTEFTWFHFSGSNTRQFYEKIEERNQTVLHCSEQNTIPRSIRRLVDSCRKAEENGTRFASESFVSDSIHHILASILFVNADQRDSSLSARNPAVLAAIHYINENYMNLVEIENIAQQVNVSRFYFTRLFRQETGCSPSEYLTLVRINRAKDLLKSTDLSIAEISEQVGYEYSTSFNSAFLKKVGVSPKKYRDMPI